jgi:hypothetical protein
MQVTSFLVAALFTASGALAAPAPATGVSMMADTQWTIESVKRTCNSADTSCDWNFGINNGSKSTACKLTVKSTKDKKASEAPGGPVTCGPYTVTSGWDGSWGAGNGFTTLAVVDNEKKLIVWPAYTDKEVKDGKAVSPNKKYTPAKI